MESAKREVSKHMRQASVLDKFPKKELNFWKCIKRFIISATMDNRKNN